MLPIALVYDTFTSFSLYSTLYVSSGGADNPRQVQLRKAKDNKWYLWEQMLLADIRKPESENQWV